MSPARVSWRSACAVSLVVHGLLLLRATGVPRPAPARQTSEEVLPVSLVGGAASSLERPSPPALPPAVPGAQLSAPGERAPKPPHAAAPTSTPGAAPSVAPGVEGSEGPNLPSAVPRALIKALVLMASHDNAWMQCAPDGSFVGKVYIATDSLGHMQAQDAQSRSASLQSTLSRALVFLSSRTFAARDAESVFQVRARCVVGTPGAFEIGDSAHAEQATGHVQFDNGRRVEFELSTQK